MWILLQCEPTQTFFQKKKSSQGETSCGHSSCHTSLSSPFTKKPLSPHGL
uniref:Uncharacterized protein n=1 Tax=Anguilla anguilla TaxID=7936 RepID=A0A0E9VHE4_ANGAN